MHTTTGLTRASSTAAWCHWSTAVPYLFRNLMLHHMKTLREKRSTRLGEGTGRRGNVMVDLVRHEFMGPGHPSIISGRPQ